jgi:peptidoglycan/LPS O-acetylase OafA/YrhL
MVARAEPAHARLFELDALRGLAALVVLLHHALHLLPSPLIPQLAGLEWLGRILLDATPLRVIVDARAAVLLFFVLSGYVLTRSLLIGGTTTSLPAYAVQRSLRILVPAAAATGASVLLRWAVFDAEAAGHAPGHHYYTWMSEPTPLRLLADVLLFRTDFNVVFWSLAHEWRLTVLLPLVLVFRRQPLMLLALAAAITTLGMVAGADEDEVLLPREALPGVAATLYFALGVGTGCALALAGSLPSLSRQQQWAAFIGVIAAFSMTSDLASYLGSALLIVLAQQPGRLRATLRRPGAVWLGRVSFSLYLIHVPVLLTAWHLLHRHAPAGLIVLIGIALSLLAAPLFFRLIEQPSRRLARRVAAWIVLSAVCRTQDAASRPPSGRVPRTSRAWSAWGCSMRSLRAASACCRARRSP